MNSGKEVESSNLEFLQHSGDVMDNCGVKCRQTRGPFLPEQDRGAKRE